MGSKQRRRVAIACQGGGSHTAFTAGVLQGILSDIPEDVEIVALSGTSGGALCATLAWDGLVRGDAKRGEQQLQAFWESMSASEPWDQIANQALLGIYAMHDLMVLPQVSPYQLPPWGEDYFRSILLNYFDFEELRELAKKPGAPALKIGAVEVLSGHFDLFSGEELSVECLLASAAIPELFRAVTVPGRGVYWDGLFSQNPPIHNLVKHRIDELWVIQINSTTCARVPTKTHEIVDRRNALSGNLSMEQELGFIRSINRAIARGEFRDTSYRPIRISRISLERELSYATKLDRGPRHLEELRDQGRAKTRWFLEEREANLRAQIAAE
jgi:NTE family protein